MSDLAFLVVLLSLAIIWYGTRRSEKGQRIFGWVVILVLVSFLVHGALWGVCGRWGPWNEVFCTEPQDDPR